MISAYNNLRLILLIKILILCVIGILALYSAAFGNLEPWSIKQIITILLFVAAMSIVSILDFKTIYNYTNFIYFMSLALLVLAALCGYKAMGAQRWVRIGFINYQPAELMKLGLILFLAKYYHDLHYNEVNTAKNMIIPLAAIVLPVILVIKQPNLGTSIVLICIAASILFAAGLTIRKFVIVGITVIIFIPLTYSLLHDYQKQRVMTFLNPESDPLGSGYNIIQSIIAIGSGGLFGKGFLKGSQNQLSFLPEKQTDFILSIIAEEFGFTGVMIILFITIGIIILCYKIAFDSNNQFFRLIVVGITTSFAIHAIINAGMISGMLPVVGMPYPLLSYGGSSLSIFLLSFALILNKKLHNYKK